MALIIPQTQSPKSSISPADEGGYSAVCCAVHDLGIQPNTFDPTKPDRREIAICFELDSIIEEPGEFNGKRRLTTFRAPVSYNEKSNLMKLLKGWIGKSITEQFMQTFDWESLIGKPAYITMVDAGKGDGKVKIGTVIDLPKGTPALSPETDPNEVPKWITEVRLKAISK